jgi:hypothetical protein
MECITSQPESQPAASNPFFETTTSDWSVDLYSCCDDKGECKYSKLLIFTIFTLIFREKTDV